MQENAFVDEKKEYKIRNMFPRRPWLNYVWNDKYLSSLNQFGFGISRFQDDAGFIKNILAKGDNRLIFIKDNESGEYYAANRNYDKLDFDVFETTVGQGYSEIESEYKGLNCVFKVFVPESGMCECWEVTLKNKAHTERNISVYAYAGIDMAITPHTAYTSADFDSELNGIYASHRAYMPPTMISGVYFASNRQPAAYETRRGRFRGEYSDIGHPIAMENDLLASEGTCFEEELDGVLQFRISIGAGDEQKLLFLLGAAENADDARTVCDSILSESAFDKSFEAVRSSINDFQDKLIIKTPDDAVNHRVNIWLKRQMELGKQWGRLYGKGFRDVMQDTMGFLPLNPVNARERILYAIEYQREDGNPVRQWMPLMRELYADGAVWLIYTVNAYLKETGDFGILDEKAGYFESDIKESVLEHCIRGVGYLQRELGEHGLCLWREGDWNDSMNGCGVLGKGESVWLSQAAVKAAGELAEILEAVGGHDELKKEVLQKAEEMKNAILSHGWDTDHFIYGINDYGERVGSYDTKEGQIFLNTQTWAILAGIVKGDEAQKLMDTVEAKLGCEYGYVQQAPSYTKGNDRIGRSSYLSVGCFENGSVYNHGTAFKIVADCMRGDSAAALRTIHRIFPDNPLNSYEHSGVEPYAMSNMYLGPECATRAGEAPQSWITGTSGWLFRGVIEGILGIQPCYSGLSVKPNLPDEWDTVTVKRVFRDCTYLIDIDNTGTGTNFCISVDGTQINGSILPLFDDKQTHSVKITRDRL